jgi:two-component system KDP operon response regulator KdpE
VAESAQMYPARILVVDDDQSVHRTIGPLLRSCGYDVLVAANGSQALRALDNRRPDLVLLDLTLPDMSGTDVCTRMRHASNMPIIVLSGPTDERSKVALLDLGADDYIVKPFGCDELLARVRAALRRVFVRDEPAGRAEFGDLVVDYDRHRVQRGGTDIRLTPKEFEMLTILTRNYGRVLSHRTLIRWIWGAEASATSDQLWVLVRQLRKKIEPDPSHPTYVSSVRWVGYQFSAADRKQ